MSESILNSLHAGAIAGLCACLFLQPLDVLKTRLQETPALKVNVQSIRGMALHIYKNEGIKAFWRGALTTACRNVPGVAIYFTSLRFIRFRIDPAPNGHHSMMVDAVAGGCARVTVAAVMMPITVLKVHLESSKTHKMNIIQAMRAIYNEGTGIKGFFRGFIPTAMRDAPHAAIYLAVYERLRRIFARLRTNTNHLPTLLDNASAGLIGGIISTIVTHPLDVIKTRIQLFPTRYPASFISASRLIKIEGGFSALWNGLLPRIARKTLSSAITWVIYEELMQLFSAKH